VTLDQAKQLKEIWLATFPEFKLFFDFIVSERIDPVNHRYSDEGKMQTSYAYLSPLGTFRANCTFCQIANGMALQTRTAEGAKKGVFDLLREQFDYTRESILYGTQTLAFIHDENITHLERHNRQLRHDQAFAATQRMIDSMQPFMPDVEVRAKPALMLRWDKRAEAVYGDDGLLDIWTPEIA
jgi:DNA polymerase-1